MKTIILFNSHVYTVKSVYRKKIRDGIIRVFLRVLETEHIFIFHIKNNKEKEYKYLKKGAIITVNIGNGEYLFIQEGKKLPEDGTVYYAEIEHIDARIKLRKKINK